MAFLRRTVWFMRSMRGNNTGAANVGQFLFNDALTIQLTDDAGTQNLIAA